jgi:antitoxin (DNA-binding transcriptional repressor) of toxin-antitoxin stability system
MEAAGKDSAAAHSMLRSCNERQREPEVTRSVSIRELRNSSSAVVSKIEAGERLTLTVNRRPVADIVPHVEERDPWVPSAELRRIVREAPSDRALLADLAEVRGAELEDA